MLGFMKNKIVSKGVREMVMIGHIQGAFKPDALNSITEGILEFSQELKLSETDLTPHQQAMAAVMGFLGVGMGPVALSDAAAWADEYGKRHFLAGAEISASIAAANHILDAYTAATTKQPSP